MTDIAEPPQKVGRIENDVLAIYHMLTGLQDTLDEHGRRLDEHTRRFNDHDQRFDQIDEALAEVLRRLPEAS